MRLRDGKSVTKENEPDELKENEVEERKEPDDTGKVCMEMAESNIEGDRLNILLLLFLYVLQGIPLGMAASIPMMLQNKNVSYKQQALFSFVYWPFSMKLLWAPIVDAAYFRQFGRRKTWLVPVQYLIGIFMLVMSMKVDVLLEGDAPNVVFLTAIFFTLNFLAATQDIAVDGWALTMLKRGNVGYASTCNSVGQTAGYFLGNVVLLAFSSKDFCNKYIRSTPQDVGIITVAGFLFFNSIVFLVTTTLLWLFKREKDTKNDHNHGIASTYLMLIKIGKLPAVQELVFILLTARIGFAGTDAVTGLKLIEAGVKKETLALLAVPLVPLQILLPLLISKFTTGPKPLNVYMKAIPCRLVFGVVFALLVYWTRIIRPEGVTEFPLYYYAVILTMYGFHQVAVYSMFVSIMAFFAKVSDPVIGGTYMTFLNTVSNLGGNWPATLMLWFVDPLSTKECTSGINICNGPAEVQACITSGGKCNTLVDGYYVETLICLVLGSLWLMWKHSSLTNLQNRKDTDWKVTHSSS